MLLHQAVEAAQVNEALVGGIAARAWQLDGIRAGIRDQIAAAFWRDVWPGIKDERITLRVWFLRPSAKIEHLRWVFVKVFGEPLA